MCFPKIAGINLSPLAYQCGKCKKKRTYKHSNFHILIIKQGKTCDVLFVTNKPPSPAVREQKTPIYAQNGPNRINKFSWLPITRSALYTRRENEFSSTDDSRKAPNSWNLGEKNNRPFKYETNTNYSSMALLNRLTIIPSSILSLSIAFPIKVFKAGLKNSKKKVKTSFHVS